MLTAPTSDEKPLSVGDFTSMYNKWLKELIDVENNLIKKAEDIQTLQCSLNEDTDTLKGVNEKLLPLQIEQNYLEDHLESLLKEQEELEREIGKLDDIDKLFVDSKTENDAEDYPEIFDTIDIELVNLSEQMKEMVEKINLKMNSHEKNKNPFMVYRTIMDRYTDALQILENSTADIYLKLDELNETD